MKGPRSVEDWFEFVPNLLSDSGWDVELDGSEMKLSHTSNPWNAHSRLVKVVVLDVVVLEPPEKPSYTLVRPELHHLFGACKVLAPGEVSTSHRGASVLFDEFGNFRTWNKQYVVTHQRLRRDFPYPGDCAYAVFNEGEDAGESVLLCSGNGHLVDLLKVFCVPDEIFYSWTQLHYQLLLESAQQVSELLLNGPALKEMRIADESLYMVLTIQSCKRGLPMYPLGVESTAAHTVTICAGEQLQLRRWRRFEPKEVGGEKFRLAQYLKLFLANLGEAVEVYETMDGRRLVPYQCVVRRSGWQQVRERFIACFLLGKTAYRRANGGSTAPILHEDVEPRFLPERATALEPFRRCPTHEHRVVVRRTFVEVESESPGPRAERTRRRPKTTTVLPVNLPLLAA